MNVGIEKVIEIGGEGYQDGLAAGIKLGYDLARQDIPDAGDTVPVRSTVNNAAASSAAAGDTLVAQMDDVVQRYGHQETYNAPMAKIMEYVRNHNRAPGAEAAASSAASPVSDGTFAAAAGRMMTDRDYLKQWPRDINRPHLIDLTPASFTTLVSTAYGLMLVNRHDINQTGALAATGKAIDAADIDMLKKIAGLLGDRPVIVDAGANFGAYTLALAPLAAEVHAFEAQRIIYYQLAGSVALSGRMNIFAHLAALGDVDGAMIEIPQFDYGRPCNFGSIEFGGEQTEKLEQERAHDGDRVEHVRQRTLDSYDLGQVDLIKLDVEGMELAALAGAGVTIDHCRPILFIETIKTDIDKLRAFLAGRDYVGLDAGMNLLAYPRERPGMGALDAIVAQRSS